MAGLAERLQVAFIPKQSIVAAMRLDVIAHKLRSIALDMSATFHLAPEQVSLENLKAKL